MSSSSTDNREFDLVIFGATGFTGFYVIRELLQSIEQNPEENGKIRWAVAGRNLQKLDSVLSSVAKELPKFKLSDVVKIRANVDEPESLAVMARRTRLVINVVGPFRLYGKPVVDACVEAGTHHIDISGEPDYIEQSQIDHHKKAVERNALIISTCGWDSMPCDFGIQFMKDKFEGRLHSVETYVKNKPGPAGYKVNTGTLFSIVYGIRYFYESFKVHRQLQQEVLNKKMPNSRIKHCQKIIPFKRPEINGWNLPFPGCDKSVVERTQYYNYHNYGETPVKVQTYIRMGSLLATFGVMVLVQIIALMSIFGFTRNLLEQYAEFFTFGVFSNQGPSREQIDGTTFTAHLFGKGWSTKNKTANDEEPSSEPDKTIEVLVSGADPAYVATSTFLVQSGLTILNDRSLMPAGGVLTPASAFRSTKILQRFESRNIKFTVLSGGGGGDN